MQGKTEEQQQGISPAAEEVLCSGEVGLRRGVEEDWGRAAASPGGAGGRRTRGIERDDGAEGKH